MEDLNLIDLYLKEINHYKRISQELTIELIKKARNGDIEARDEIAKHYLGLVFHIARKFKIKSLPLLDAVQIGSEAIFTCINNYDINSEIDFGYYLYCSVKYCIKREQGKYLTTIHIPSYCSLILINIKNFCKQFLLKNNREATDDEIMKELKVKKELIDIYRLFVDHKLEISYELLREIEQNTFMRDEEFRLESELSKDENGFDEVIDKLDTDSIENVIRNSSLSDKRKYILLYKYGFIDGKTHHTSELARMYGNSHQAIRELEEKSLSNLRTPQMLRRYKY